MDKTKNLKKIGEALAFSRVGEDLFIRAKGALVSGFGETWYGSKLKEIIEAREGVDGLVRSFEDGSAVVEEKVAKTTEKIENMQSIYLTEDDWNDLDEVVEWMSFWVGGAIVHWAVLERSFKALNVSEAIALWGRDVFSVILEDLIEYGKKQKQV